MYFNDIDFETFNEEYVQANTKEIRERRKEIQEKLLDINAEVKDILAKKYNLHNHWKKANVTSLLFPCEYNHGIVNWIGVRYGRSESEIKLLNFGKEQNDDYLGYQKYNCFQINIAREGVEIGIYHSVPHDSVDRAYVREQLYNNNQIFEQKLIDEIENLQGYGYEFSVTWLDKVADKWENRVFAFDNLEKEKIGKEFIEFYKQNCLDGRYSSILYHYPRKDERIANKQNIEAELLKHVDKLYPLYKALSWSPKV